MNLDPLEQTQDFMNPLGNGVWRRSSDPDTLEADLDDGMRSYSRAPELSHSSCQVTPADDDFVQDLMKRVKQRERC